jgi:uncharacterized protein with HEPN domain
MASDQSQDAVIRNVLIHDYIGVDLDEVWNVASARIPEFEAVLGEYLSDENQGTAPDSTFTF